MPDTREVTRVDTFEATANVTEFLVQAARETVTYPGLQQCISVTGHDDGRVVGTHISPGASADQVRQHFEFLTELAGRPLDTWYVAGQFTNHFATAGAPMDSMQKVGDTLREHLGENSTFQLFDTTDVTVKEHWTYGIDVRATLTGGDISFSFAKSGGRRDKEFHGLNKWFFNRI